MDKKAPFLYTPVKDKVLLIELEDPTDWEEAGNNLAIKKSVARGGLFFKGKILMTGEDVTTFKAGDVVLFNIIEGFKYLQTFNNQIFALRIIPSQYIIPMTLKE